MLRNWALALRPTLSLDFLAGLNDSRITYSGGANGTRVNSSGVIVAATTPRFDYDPVTLAAKGLLVEEARTNLLLRSQEFDNASWTKVETTVTADAIASPSGAVNADKLVPSTNNAEHYARQTLTGLSAGYTASYTIYVKAAEYSILRVRVLNTDSPTDGFIGTIVSATGAVAGASFGSGTIVSVEAEAVGNGWYRLKVVGTTGVTSTKAIVDAFVINGTNISGSATYAGDGTSGLYLWGAQLEAGSLPTSYIPTTSAAVTRTADSAVMTGTNFSSWYSQAQGTFVFAGSRLTAGGTVGVAFGAARTGDFNNSIYAANAAASQMATSVLSGGVAQAATVGSPASVLVPFKFAAAYAANDFSSCANGGAVGVDGAGTPPTLLDIFTIGSAPWAPPANSWNGHIRSIVFYPGRLSNEQLQALTA